jgi:hypothetical protein
VDWGILPKFARFLGPESSIYLSARYWYTTYGVAATSRQVIADFRVLCILQVMNRVEE